MKVTDEMMGTAQAAAKRCGLFVYGGDVRAMLEAALRDVPDPVQGPFVLSCAAAKARRRRAAGYALAGADVDELCRDLDRAVSTLGPRQAERGEWAQEDRDVATDAMLAFRKSGGDWTDKPTHAASAVLDAVAYRLVPATPVQPGGYSDEQVSRAFSSFFDTDHAEFRWSDEEMSSMRAALAAAGVPAQTDERYEMLAQDFAGADADRKTLARRVAELQRAQSEAIDALELREGHDQFRDEQLLVEGCKHVAQTLKDCHTRIAELKAQLAAQAVEPLSEELREEALSVLRDWQPNTNSHRTAAELLRRCSKPEPKQRTADELAGIIGKHLAGAPQRVLDAVIELRALATPSGSPT